MIDNSSNNAIQRLKLLFSNISQKSVIIAFSGGVDSSVIAFLANKYCQKALAITLKSCFYPEYELNNAIITAKNIGISHLILEIDPEEDSSVWENPPNRCYYCKKMDLSSLIAYAKQNIYDIVIEGTNISDLAGHRPGHKAIKELNIISPYLKTNISKTEIREIAQNLGLKVANKPASPCLASRIPYGQKITRTNLKMVEKAEELIRNHGFLSRLRVRWDHNNAKIEVDPEKIQEFVHFNNSYHINQKLKELGFKSVSLDLEGYKPMIP